MVIGIDASRANQREKTGTEWYSWHLIRALASRLPDHQLRLYTREPLEPGLQNLGPQIESRVLTWKPGLLWSHLRLAWELLRHPPDVVFIPADTVPLIRRRPTVTTIHDIAFERFPELYAKRSVQRRLGWLRPIIQLLVRLVTGGRYGASELDYHRWSVRHALRVSRDILTVSAFTKNEMIEVLQARPDRIQVTYQGVIQPKQVPTFDQAAKNRLRAKHHLSRRYWLFIGRLETKKNIQQLVQAYQQYAESASDPADLVLVGSPGYGWETVAARLPLMRHGRVHVLGWQPETDVHGLLSDAHGFLFLSAYEGFGRPPLEAMSFGVPVLSSPAGSLPEVLGSAAAYADPKNTNQVVETLRRLDRDTDWRKQLRDAGFQQVRKFTWQSTADRTAAVLLK